MQWELFQTNCETHPLPRSNLTPGPYNLVLTSFKMLAVGGAQEPPGNVGAAAMITKHVTRQPSQEQLSYNNFQPLLVTPLCSGTQKPWKTANWFSVFQKSWKPLNKKQGKKYPQKNPQKIQRGKKDFMMKKITGFFNLFRVHISSSSMWKAYFSQLP